MTRKQRLSNLIVAAAMIALFAGFTPLVAEAQVAESVSSNSSYEAWMGSYDEALKKSRQTGRPVMLVFSGSDWNQGSKRLTNEVFRSHEFARWSTRNVVKYEVDFPRHYTLPAKHRQLHDQLKKRYAGMIKDLPTVLMINAEGQVLGAFQYGGQGAAGFISKATWFLPPHPTADDKTA